MVSRYAITSGTADVRLIKDARPAAATLVAKFSALSTGRKLIQVARADKRGGGDGWSELLVIPSEAEGSRGDT
jgi:hypothetical protein